MVRGHGKKSPFLREANIRIARIVKENRELVA